MKHWPAITRLLSILAILGLVLAPFTVPAVAGGMIAPMTRAGIQMSTVSAGNDVVMANVPCYLPAQPFMPECPKACPLATHCLSKIFQDVPAIDAMPGQFSIAQARVPGNDATPATLPQAPPSRPPQA